MALDLSDPELRALLRSSCLLTQYKCLHHRILTTWSRDRRDPREQPVLVHGCDCQDPAWTQKNLQDPKIWEAFTP